MIALVSPAASLATAALAGGACFAALPRTVLVARDAAWPRRGASAALAFAAVAHLTWAADLGDPIHGRAVAAATIATFVLVAAALALPASWLAARVARRLARPRPSPRAAPELPSPARRALVGAAAAAPVAAAVGGVLHGFSTSAAPPLVPRVRVALPELPDDLAGLTILQLTDLHLGAERHAGDVDALVTRLLAARAVPDLVAVTGDVAEHPEELDAFFAALARLDPRLGIVACLGNHEYLTSPEPLRRACRRAGARLLVDEGTLLRVGSAKLWVGGVDDPRRMRGGIARALAPGVERALRDAPRDATTLLLSHRPDGLLPAAERNADLVLAGHTHGGQIGWGDRSAFEPVLDGHYLWGDYVRGRTALYTSSGFGHWFPFRVACPTEAPLVRLERAAHSSTRTSRTTSPARIASSGPSARPTHA